MSHNFLLDFVQIVIVLTFIYHTENLPDILDKLIYLHPLTLRTSITASKVFRQL